MQKRNNETYLKLSLMFFVFVFIIFLSHQNLLAQVLEQTSTVQIKNQSREWVITKHSGEEKELYNIEIADKKLKATEICLISKNDSKTSDKNKISLYDENGVKIKDINKQKKNLKDAFCNQVTTEEYLRFGEQSTIIEYQYIKTINYNDEKTDINLTLYKYINEEWNNTVNSIWLNSQIENYKFGANDTGTVSGENATYKYSLQSTQKIRKNSDYSYSILNSGFEKKFEFTDVCQKKEKCELILYEESCAPYSEHCDSNIFDIVCTTLFDPQCSFNFSTDLKQLEVIFKAEHNNTLGLTQIDPVLGVINITKAEHLNSTRGFISDIYNEVFLLDNNWSEDIPANDYVRVTFEENLTSRNNIRLYSRITSGNPTLEFYEFNESILLGEINPIINNSYNTFYLINLTDFQDTFDIRIMGGTMQFDHIYDPDTTFPELNFTFPTPASGTSTTNSTFPINISIVEETQLKTVNYSFNNNNYSYYDYSVILHLNLRNSSILGENDAKVVDSSMYSNNGTVTNADWTSSGKYSGAYSFLGHQKNNYINLGITPSLNQSFKSITVAAWVYPTSAGQFKTIASRYLTWTPTNNKKMDWMLRLDSQKFNFQVSNSTVTKVAQGTSSTLNEWHYVVGSWNGTTVFIYVDGQLINTTLQSTMTSTHVPTYIGASQYSINSVADEFFNGTIDEVMIWNRSLSASEVQQSYLMNLQKYNSTQWYLYINQSLNALPSGTYKYQACASDTANNGNCTEERTFTVSDLTAPSLTIHNPESGRFYASTSVPLNVSSPSTDISTWWWTLNGGTTNTTFTPNTTITGTEGSNTVIVYINDTSNNVNSSSVTFSVDTIFPIVNITTPFNNTNFIANNIEINYSIAETNPSNCWWTEDNGITNTTLASCGTNITGEVWDEGANNVVLYINDSVNNVNSTHVKFTLDMQNPQINLTHPFNISFNTIQTQINFTVSDTLLGSCWYSLDLGVTNVSTSCSANITGLTSNQGSNTWTVYANDSINRQNSSRVTFFVDSIQPSINLTSPTPANNSMINANNFVVNFTGTELNFGSGWVTFNNTNFTATCSGTSPYYCNYTISNIKDGNYNYTAYANDSLGNYNFTETRNITIDTTIPNINFTSPTEAGGTTFARNYIFVNVTVTETNPSNITFYLSNSSRGLINTTMLVMPSQLINTSLNFSGLASGLYFYNVTITDKVNNRNSTETINITLDTTAPTINYISPLNTTTNTAGVITFSANTTDGESVLWWYTFTGQTVNFTLPSAISFSDSRTLTAGTYNVTVYANDSLGNLATFTEYNVVISAEGTRTVYPTISTGSFYKRQETLIISVSAEDAEGTPVNTENITYVVKYPNASIWISNVSIPSIGGGFYRTSKFLPSTLPFGTYGIEVTSSSFLGAHSFILQSGSSDTLPSIDFVSPSMSSGTYPQDYILVNISASDTNGIDTITVYLHNLTAQVNQTTGSTSPLYLNISNLSATTYYLNASVNSSLGSLAYTPTRTIQLSVGSTVADSGTGGGYSPNQKPSVVDKFLCNETLKYINTYGYSEDWIHPFLQEVQKNSGKTPSWFTFRDYVNNWQVFCSDELEISLNESEVCDRVFYFLVGNNGIYTNSDIKALNRDYLKDIKISNNLLDSYASEYSTKCISINKPLPFSIRQNIFNSNNNSTITEEYCLLDIEDYPSVFSYTLPLFTFYSQNTCQTQKTASLFFRIYRLNESTFVYDGIRVWWMIFGLILITLTSIFVIYKRTKKIGKRR